jgi:hypothetical protein
MKWTDEIIDEVIARTVIARKPTDRAKYDFHPEPLTDPRSLRVGGKHHTVVKGAAIVKKKTKKPFDADMISKALHEIGVEMSPETVAIVLSRLTARDSKAATNHGIFVRAK